ncbi:MAG TPA: NlpC/P60 family protein [Alphaproteobacteria bacterium]|nr:NlpC/P60 family protein [Alphaproteobacteria bacterium]
MTVQTDMIQAARACLGTPFHHQGREALMGLDCVGLVAHALRAAGRPVDDRTNYSRQPDVKQLMLALSMHGFKRVEEIAPGDVLLFRFNRQPQHVALAISETQIIHAYAPIGRVVEAGLSESWLRRLAGIYRLMD